MKIGFDAKRLFNNPTGLGNYARTLVKQLHQFYPEIDLVLFTPKVHIHPYNEWFVDQSNIKIVEKSTRFPAWRSWGIVEAIKQEKVDIYHGLSNELPIKRLPNSIKSVVTIHDLIFRVFTQQYTWVDRKLYNYKSNQACKNADCIISISQSTKKDILHFYPHTKVPIHVIYQSCRPYKPVAHPARDYYLFVSSINERKGLKDILQCMCLQHETERIYLKVVGKGGAYEEHLRNFVSAHQLDAWVEWLGNVEDEKLEGLYQHAKALIYPSLYEGFGIPVIEALSTKTPVITSNSSSMPEAGGDQALYIKPGDVQSLQETIKQLEAWVFDNDGLEKHLKQFDSKHVTDILVDNYRNLLP